MNVTFLNPASGLGGAERCLLDMIVATRLAEPRFNPTVILLGDGPLVAALTQLRVATHVVPLPDSLSTAGDSGIRSAGGFVSLAARLAASLPAARGVVRRIHEIIRGTGTQIVHSNGLKTHLLTRWVVPSGCRTICHLHDFISTRPVVASLLPICVADGSFFIANSHSVAEDARSVVKNPQNVRTVYNAIDTDAFSPEDVDASWLDVAGGASAPAANVLRVGLVATYARWKGQDVFIHAISRLPEKVRHAARFFIVGGPIYATAGSQWSVEALRDIARQSGVEREIAFVPFQADAARVMRSLDVVVHASSQPEPFGRTIVEAMACGRATIVARAGGAAELFEPGVHALGFPPGDVAALADAIVRLITHPDARQQLAAAARPHVVSAFGLSRLGREILEVYRLVGGRSPASD